MTTNTRAPKPGSESEGLEKKVGSPAHKNNGVVTHPAEQAFLEQISPFRVDSLEPSEVVRLTSAGETEELEIKETLRLGNEGITYYTQDQNTKKDRGLKIVRTKLGKKPAKIEATARNTYAEINRLLGTNYKVGRANVADIYVTYEFVPGKDLENARAEKKEWSDIELTSFIEQTTTQLAKLHAGNIIHRDIKPPNIITSTEGEEQQYTIIDFGLARDTESLLMSTSDYSLNREGTIAYMRWNDTGKPDPRDDLYALGKIVYFLRTGQHLPLVGKASLLADKYEEAIEPLRLDPILKERVYRLIGIDPATEFKNAGEVVATFQEKALENNGVIESKPNDQALQLPVTGDLAYKIKTLGEELKSARRKIRFTAAAWHLLGIKYYGMSNEDWTEKQTRKAIELEKTVEALDDRLKRENSLEQRMTYVKANFEITKGLEDGEIRKAAMQTRINEIKNSLTELGYEPPVIIPNQTNQNIQRFIRKRWDEYEVVVLEIEGEPEITYLRTKSREKGIKKTVQDIPLSRIANYFIPGVGTVGMILMDYLHNLATLPQVGGDIGRGVLAAGLMLIGDRLFYGKQYHGSKALEYALQPKVIDHMPSIQALNDGVSPDAESMRRIKIKGRW